MHSVPSKSENNIDPLYRKNQVKSVSFLIILSGILLLTVLFSLRAGSYETPIAELVKGGGVPPLGGKGKFHTFYASS